MYLSFKVISLYFLVSQFVSGTAIDALLPIRIKVSGFESSLSRISAILQILTLSFAIITLQSLQLTKFCILSFIRSLSQFSTGLVLIFKACNILELDDNYFLLWSLFIDGVCKFELNNAALQFFFRLAQSFDRS